MKFPISVVILTYNEEKNIEDCLKSVCDFVDEIFVVDSYSADKTIEIIKNYTNKIYQHEFENYGKQRNWALDNLPLRCWWILNLDADIRVSKELKDELEEIFKNNRQENYDGFLIPRKTIFMGRWIKHGGHYPVYHAVLFRRGAGRCEETRYNQHFYINGKVKKTKCALEDIVTSDLANFISRHNNWAEMEALDRVLGEDQVTNKKGVKQDIFGTPQEKRRFFRQLYLYLPLLVKPFLYFFYRYFIRLGFLDGKEGLIFHTLQAFWYQFLVDAKIYEYKKNLHINKQD